MIKFIYRLFKKQFNQLAYFDQVRVDRRHGLRFGFVLDGVNYYVYPNVFDLPMMRLHRVQMLLNQLRAVVSDDELQTFLSNMEEALDSATSGNQVKNLARIGFLITELKNRKAMLVHPDLMLRIAAALCISETEDPTDWNDEAENKKFELIKQHYSEGALFPFFRQVGLTQFLPNLNSIEEDFTLFWEASKSRIQAVNEILKK